MTTRQGKEWMDCTCCGGGVGWYKQHWNQDNGYSVCADCIVIVFRPRHTEEEIKQLYGIEGVNYPNIPKT